MSLNKNFELHFTFSATPDDCYLCFDQLIDGKTISLGCEHRMCKTCSRKYFVEHVSELRTDRCKCPDIGCDIKADAELIKHFVDIYNTEGKKILGKTDKQDKTKSLVRPNSILLLDMSKGVVSVGLQEVTILC